MQARLTKNELINRLSYANTGADGRYQNLEDLLYHYCSIRTHAVGEFHNNVDDQVYWILDAIAESLLDE